MVYTVNCGSLPLFNTHGSQLDAQMAYWHPPGCTVPQTAAKRLWRSLAPAAVQVLLLLACTTLHLTGADARSLAANRLIPHIFERRLEAVALPAGNGNEGWTLGRASFNGPPDSFSSKFQRR